MQMYEFLTLIGMIAGSLGWMLFKIEKLGSKIEGISNRLMKVETQMEGIEKRITSLEHQMSQLQGMMQTIVGFLLGHRTGTDK